ncbi:MAG: imidazole glycerol phosphate synthase subunit HisH [Flavobacteriales bacterium]|nr:MAG: imidazole glycerol phosphate synthase subunit HisH [Flavobacteriales bacterium]
MIVIVDYAVGNIGSILNMLKKIGVEAMISSSAEDLEKADKLILPGVGAFDSGMNKLQELGFVDVLNKKVLEEKTPILGICLGMQLMTKGSEEGILPGLGWFDAKAVKFIFENGSRLKVPHMGWNYADTAKPSKLFENMFDDPRFYFVHSYYIKCNCTEDVLSETNYSVGFVSGFERDNIYGVQFHPEKSHKFGLRFLKNFSEL